MRPACDMARGWSEREIGVFGLGRGSSRSIRFAMGRGRFYQPTLWTCFVQVLAFASRCPHARERTRRTTRNAKEPPAISLQSAVRSRGALLRYMFLSSHSSAAHFMCVFMCE